MEKISEANWWKYLMNLLTVKGIPSRMLLYRYNFSTRRRLHQIVKWYFVIQKQTCKSIKSRQSRCVIMKTFRRDKAYVVGVIFPPLIVIGLMYLNILEMRLSYHWLHHCNKTNFSMPKYGSEEPPKLDKTGAPVNHVINSLLDNYLSSWFEKSCRFTARDESSNSW